MKVIKYILFLFIFIMVSCKSTKIQDIPAPPPPVASVLEAEPSDLMEGEDDRDGVTDYLDYEPQIVKSSAPVDRQIEKSDSTLNYVIPDTKFTQTCAVGKIEPRPKGLIAYSVPTEMQVGKEYSVKVRISKKNDRTVLIVGDREIPISDDTNSVKVESISVSPIMSANLLSQKGNFEITSLSTEIQNIDEEGYTEWAWAVTPLVGGQNNLKLNIKIRIKENGETCYKDITVFEKKIKVKSNIGFSIKEFFLNNWEWFMGAILIPIIQWIWGLWKKRKEEKEKDVS